MTTTEKHSPTAAGSGANATESFRRTGAQGGAAGERIGAERIDTERIDTERIDTVARAVLEGVHAAIRTHKVTYAEFQAAKEWLIEVGEGGEWPLFLDVFVEHVVEEVAAETQQGTKGSILGPYYLPGQQRLTSPATLPMRPDEAGTPLVLAGQVRDTAGRPVAGAELDVWQADEQGYYSGFAPDIPDGNLRGVVVTDAEGRFEISSVLPAPYQIPTDGPTGALCVSAGWAPWRPAHLHLLVGAPGHRRITTQLYFQGGDWLDADIADATKPELVLDPAPQPDGRLRADYDFVLEPTP